MFDVGRKSGSWERGWRRKRDRPLVLQGSPALSAGAAALTWEYSSAKREVRLEPCRLREARWRLLGVVPAGVPDSAREASNRGQAGEGCCWAGLERGGWRAWLERSGHSCRLGSGMQDPGPACRGNAWASSARLLPAFPG